MRTNEIRKAVFRIIEKYTDVKIKSDTLLFEEALLDSMDQVQICMDLEAEYGIQVENDKLFSYEPGKATAEDMVNLVKEKLEELEKESEETSGNETSDKDTPSEETFSEVASEDDIIYLSPEKIGKGTAPQLNGGGKGWLSITEEYLHPRIKVWCENKGCWETDNLTITPNGDFIDERQRVHRQLTHTAYVRLDDAIEAVRTTLFRLLDNKEWELEKLKQDNYLLEKLQELSKTQEQIGRDSIYNKEIKTTDYDV